MPMYICPECHEHINYIRFNTNGYEYGDYNPDTGDYDYQDSSFDGETTYYCPECDEEISNPDNLEIAGDDENSDNDEAVTTNEKPGEASNNKMICWICNECETSNMVKESICTGCGGERITHTRETIKINP